jgi:hypothetical protein
MRCVSWLVPAVEVAVLAVDEYRLRQRVDGGGIDAPFLDRDRAAWLERRAGDGQDLLHDGAAGNRVDLRRARVDDGELVDAVAGADAKVVVVLGHQQVARRTRIRRHHRRRHDRRRVVPAEAARHRLRRQRRIEVEQPAARVVRAERRLENAEVDVAVGTDRRGSGRVVADPREGVRHRVEQQRAALDGKRGAVEREQVAALRLPGDHGRIDGDVQRVGVRRQRRGAVHLHLGDCRIGCGRRGRRPDAAAVGVHPRDAADEPGRVRRRHHEAEEDVALRVDRERRVDEDAGIERRWRRIVGSGAVEDDRAQRATAGIGIVLDEQFAARAGDVEAVPRGQRGVVARHPVVRWQLVVGGRRPDHAAVAARPRFDAKAAVGAGLDRQHDGVVRGDDRRPVVNEQCTAGRVRRCEVERRRPGDAVEVLRRDRAVRRVLRIAAEAEPGGAVDRRRRNNRRRSCVAASAAATGQRRDGDEHGQPEPQRRLGP